MRTGEAHKITHPNPSHHTHLAEVHVNSCGHLCLHEGGHLRVRVSEHLQVFLLRGSWAQPGGNTVTIWPSQTRCAKTLRSTWEGGGGGRRGCKACLLAALCSIAPRGAPEGKHILHA